MAIASSQGEDRLTLNSPIKNILTLSMPYISMKVNIEV